MLGKLRKYNNKFSIDVIWNLGGFVLSGIIFVVINAILLKVYDEAVVGVFNQVFAVYMLLAQLAVAGLHLSVQQFIPRYTKVRQHSDVVLSGALIITFLFGSVITLLVWFLRDIPGEFFDSLDFNEAFPLVVWGLVFFAMNKVLLAFHNGFRRMRAFAVFQFLRIFSMLGVLVAFILFTDNTNFIPSLLAVAEFVVFVVLLLFTFRHFTLRLSKRVMQWVRIHAWYGLRALPGNLLLDANSRVDVMMLGFFLEDDRVGVYSFALMIAEGVLQIPMIFRNNINPIISKAKGMKHGDRILNKLLKRNVRAFYKLVTPLALATILLFPVGMWILQVDEHLYEFWTVYAILVGAIALAGGYLPFQMLFNQLGKPGLHSWFIAGFFIVNCAGNYFLIPHLEIFGAAVGTGLSILAQVVLLRILLPSYTRYRI